MTLLFLSTPSARRATSIAVPISATSRRFLSTPSARRATDQAIGAAKFLQDFYPRPPRGGRQFRRAAGVGCIAISIHALREEGDQSVRVRWGHLGDFYPRPPRGGRPAAEAPAVTVSMISIHALREEGDFMQSDVPASAEKFLSTPSARRATKTQVPVVQLLAHFYPRPPRGGRPDTRLMTLRLTVFLSTPSARRATMDVWTECYRRDISIHALREEGDPPASR